MISDSCRLKALLEAAKMCNENDRDRWEAYMNEIDKILLDVHVIVDLLKNDIYDDFDFNIPSEEWIWMQNIQLHNEYPFSDLPIKACDSILETLAKKIPDAYRMNSPHGRIYCVPPLLECNKKKEQKGDKHGS